MVSGKVRIFSTKLLERPKKEVKHVTETPVTATNTSTNSIAGASDVVTERVTEDEREPMIRVLTPSELQHVAERLGARATADDKTRVVEVDERRYRVVFRITEDATAFQSLTSKGSKASVDGDRLCTSYGRSRICFDLELSEAL